MAVRRNTRGGSSAREESSSARGGAKPIRTSYRGAAGRQQMEEEQKRSEARREANKARSNQPFRFWCPAGETRQIVIVDEAPDFFRYEHALKDKRSGRYDIYVPCIDEHANCPVCPAEEKPSYFGMYLTIIDLTPYDNADGDEVEWSKKILLAKPAQQKKINRLYEKHGTLRGMVLDMTRDGKKDAAIGNDIEFVEFMEEDELETYVTEYTDKDGKVHEVVGFEPYDYDEIFPDMAEDQLSKLAGITGGSVGNRGDDDREIGRRPRRLGRGSNKDEEEEERRPARQASRRGARDEEEEERPVRGRRVARDEEEEEEEQRPARGRRGAREEEEEPPARAKRGADAAPPARGSRRPAKVEEEEEEEQRPVRSARGTRRGTAEDVPFDNPTRTSTASRREQTRGRR